MRYGQSDFLHDNLVQTRQVIPLESSFIALSPYVIKLIKSNSVIELLIFKKCRIFGKFGRVHQRYFTVNQSQNI